MIPGEILGQNTGFSFRKPFTFDSAGFQFEDPANMLLQGLLFVHHFLHAHDSDLFLKCQWGFMICHWSQQNISRALQMPCCSMTVVWWAWRRVIRTEEYPYRQKVRLPPNWIFCKDMENWWKTCEKIGALKSIDHSFSCKFGDGWCDFACSKRLLKWRLVQLSPQLCTLSRSLSSLLSLREKWIEPCQPLQIKNKPATNRKCDPVSTSEGSGILYFLRHFWDLKLR